MKKVIFLSELDFTSWSKNGKWRIEHFISNDLFLKGKFSITEINPRIIYNDFTYLRPLFVEVEVKEKEQWAYLIDITACFCHQQYIVQQQQLVHEKLGTSSIIPIEKWPLEVEETFKQWMTDSEFFDAKIGGSRITEMLFTQLYDPLELKQWIKLKQEGLGIHSIQSHLCHILQYQREHQIKGFLGAVADLGRSLKPLAKKNEQIETINDILRPIATDSSKSDSEILNKVRQDICGNDKLTTSWKALVCPFILYFAMKYSGAISDSTVKIEVCQQFIKQWTTYGFVYEIREACWLLGFHAHASNFSRQYIEWKFQRKETLLNKEANFQKDDNTIPLSSNQNVSAEKALTKPDDHPIHCNSVDTSSTDGQKSTTTQVTTVPNPIKPVKDLRNDDTYQQPKSSPINDQTISPETTTPNSPSDKQNQTKNPPSKNDVVPPENPDSMKQDPIEAPKQPTTRKGGKTTSSKKNKKKGGESSTKTDNE
ncbi:MAG: hypothetical protein IJV69_00010 [Kiritimatiellae bacterium]|nr:hypothetical protein [Kiritimatiellia bacterium]